MSRMIKIFDTTLRDGEQCPGAGMNREAKRSVARMLEKLHVDVIEAGFPVSSPEDFESVKMIAQSVTYPIIAALARAKEKDIDVAWEALRPAKRARIHTFLATSPIHMQYKLKMQPTDVLDAAVAAVKHARRYTDDVEFSPEDATRSDEDFLCRVVEAVIVAGATTVNIPDTVGYAIPDEFSALILMLKNRVPNMDRAVLSVHCHNDLGLAVSNSLAAVYAGAGQVECTINGIGERAGNAAMEEIVMALKVRKNYFDVETGIQTDEIAKASRLVSGVTGIVVQPNKAIVGGNAFAHEAGIHQDGLLKDKRTYEIMTPESVGVVQHRLVLGKHSGRHALTVRLKELGFDLSETVLEAIFERFKKLSDQKREVTDEDLQAIVTETSSPVSEVYVLDGLHVESGTSTKPTATIELSIRGEKVLKVGQGDGPVDAVYHAIAEMTETKSRLESYVVHAITGGTDALGEVTVRLVEAGHTAIGHGADTDIIVASARAYIHALNELELFRGTK